MTPEMWRVLDFENLREAALNSLAEAAEKGIEGFFDVNIVEKAGPAKNRYFQAATKTDVEAFTSDSTKPPGFGNSKDVANLTPAANRLSQWVSDISLLIATGVTAAYIVKLWSQMEELEAREEANQAGREESGEPFDATPAQPPEGITADDWADYQELTELAESGSLDNLDDIDAALMIALYLFDKYPDDEMLESIIDELETAQDEF
jgi:hypothetical protein